MRVLMRTFAGDILNAAAGADTELTESNLRKVQLTKGANIIHRLVRGSIYIDGTLADEIKCLAWWAMQIKVAGTVVLEVPLNRLAGKRPGIATNGALATGQTEHAISRGDGELAGFPIPSEESVAVSVVPAGDDTRANSAPAADTAVSITLQLVEEVVGDA